MAPIWRPQFVGLARPEGCQPTHVLYAETCGPLVLRGGQSFRLPALQLSRTHSDQVARRRQFV